MRLYRIDRRSGYVRRSITAALGLADHVQQVEIYVRAATKAAARDLVVATENVTPSSLAFRVADGVTGTALADLPGPAVYVVAGLGYSAPDERVLRVDTDGSTCRVGRLERVTYGVAVFVAEGGAA